jgi:hypothetical protein
VNGRKAKRYCKVFWLYLSAFVGTFRRRVNFFLRLNIIFLFLQYLYSWFHWPGRCGGVCPCSSRLIVLMDFFRHSSSQKNPHRLSHSRLNHHSIPTCSLPTIPIRRRLFCRHEICFDTTRHAYRPTPARRQSGRYSRL